MTQTKCRSKGEKGRCSAILSYRPAECFQNSHKLSGRFQSNLVIEKHDHNTHNKNRRTQQSLANTKCCCSCGEALDVYELDHEDCVFCFLDRGKLHKQFVCQSKGLFRELLNEMGGVAGADRIGDPSPWRENAVRAMEDNLSFAD